MKKLQINDLYCGLRGKIDGWSVIIAQVRTGEFLAIGLDNGNRITDPPLRARAMLKYLRDRKFKQEAN